MNINFKNLVSLLFIIIGANSSIAQHDHRLRISLTAGMSKTGSLIYGDEYRKFDISPTIKILKTSLSRNNNYNFGIGYQFSRSILINGSIGVASYGFQYRGDVTASPLNSASVGGFIAQQTYTTRLMEVNLSTSYHYELNQALSIIIQPGISWYTNPREDSRQVLGVLMKGNNFSATFFTGVEVPMISNIFFIRAGVSTKIALDNFSVFFDFDNKFHPYSIGLQTSISYRFWSK